MLNHRGDGIICDYCTALAGTDFTYYSYDFRQVDVTNGVKLISDQVILSADLCEACMEAYRERVRKAYAPPVPGLFRCDISGEVSHTPNFTYFRCLISKVDVHLSGVPYTCEQCSKARSPDEGPCPECKPGTTLKRIGQVTTDNKYLELNFSVAMYDKFVAHLNKVRKVGFEEWATK